MRYVSHPPRGNQRARRCRGGDAGVTDELGGAVEPGFLSLRRGTVPQQLLRHEKRSCWAGRRAAQGGGSAVLRRVQGRSLFLSAEVVLGVVVVVVRWVLDAALRSSVSARAAARSGGRRSGGGAGRPARKAFAHIQHEGI